MTVGQLTAQLSEDELAEWIAYDSLDPIGGYRSDMQTALLAYMQSGDSSANLSDFLLFDPDPVSEEEQARREEEAYQAKLRQQAQAMQDYFLYLKGNNGLPDG